MPRAATSMKHHRPAGRRPTIARSARPRAIAVLARRGVAPPRWGRRGRDELLRVPRAVVLDKRSPLTRDGGSDNAQQVAETATQASVRQRGEPVLSELCRTPQSAGPTVGRRAAVEVAHARQRSYDQDISYWSDIFTLETWAQAAARDFAVTGFPPPTAGKGGYSSGMFDRVEVGDVLLCYCKAPAGRWVGALRITGRAYESDEPVWGIAADGTVRFPWRFDVEPIITLDPLRGLPGPEVAAEVGFLKRLKQWGTFLQRSLNRIPDEDGDRLLSLLREPRAEVPISRSNSRRRRVDAPEPTLLDAQALPLRLEAPPPPEDGPDPEPRVHTEIQAKLRDIGIYEGYDVWVADRGVEWNGAALGDGCLRDLPVVAAEPTRRVMRRIDVIWFRRGAGHPERFYEIENSTSVYSGLLRFNDVMIDFPIPDAFIVGDGDKTLAKFEREIARRTFEHSGLRSVTQFLYYEQVRDTWKRFQAIGAGSKEWGQPARRDTRASG